MAEVIENEFHASSPFAIAIKDDDSESVQELLGGVVDIECKNDDGQTFIHYAAHHRKPKALEALLRDRRSVRILKARDCRGSTALIEVARQADTGEALLIAKMLLGKCPDLINMLDDVRRSALFYAVENKPSEQTRRFFNLLMDYDADVQSVQNNEDASRNNLQQYLKKYKPGQVNPTSPSPGLENVTRFQSNTSVSSTDTRFTHPTLGPF